MRASYHLILSEPDLEDNAKLHIQTYPTITYKQSTTIKCTFVDRS